MTAPHTARDPLLDDSGVPLDDVLGGLSQMPKRLPCRLLYDPAGAALFEAICRLDAYYPTRTEVALLQEHLPMLADEVGPEARVIEPGSGEGIKTELLLRALDRPATYVPIDVAADQLELTAARLRRDHPGLEVAPLVGDYTKPLVLPASTRSHQKTVVFFPGSTIGNFEPAEATAFLARLARLAGPRSLLILGADATRDEARLVRAYDDEAGVTAAFNKNILAHLNRDRGATFDLDAFDHRAVWNRQASRIEMHLVSRTEQVVRLDNSVVAFDAGEPIITEHCYKHAPAALQSYLHAAGWHALNTISARDVPFRLWLCET